MGCFEGPEAGPGSSLNHLPGVEFVAQGVEDAEVVVDGVVGVRRAGFQAASGQGGVVL